MIVPIKLHRFENPTDTIADYPNDTLDYGEALFEASTGYLYVSPADGTKISDLVPVNANLPAKKLITEDGRVQLGVAHGGVSDSIGTLYIDRANGNLVGKVGGGSRMSRGLENVGLINCYANGLPYAKLTNDVGAGSVVNQPIYGADDPNVLQAGGKLSPAEGQLYFRLTSKG